MESSLIIYGDALVEISALVEKLPEHGQDSIAKLITLKPGGSASNCAVVASKLGARVKFISMVGNDFYGNMVIDDLISQDVDLSSIKVVEGDTATVIVMIDNTGERTMISYRGVAEVEPYGSVSDIIFKPGDILHVSGYNFQSKFSKATSLELIELAKQQQVKISLDPSYNFANLSNSEYSEVLSSLDYFFPNQIEALVASKSDCIFEAMSTFHKKGVDTVLLKMGANGCYYSNSREREKIDAYVIPDPIDTTGAGDAFAGGFLAATLKNLSHIEAMKIGAAAASIIVNVIGGHSASLDTGRLSEFALRHDDYQLFQAIKKLDEKR